ncbi:MAG: hypothetical protein C4318_01515 [Acidimicrobiia bacterium]
MNTRGVALFGLSVCAALSLLASRSITTTGWLTETLLVFAPILCAAAAARTCFEGGLYNLGAEGQLYAGAVAAAGAGAALGGLGGGWLITATCLFCAALGGCTLGWTAGAARARLGMNEAVVTIMLNFIAIAIARFFASGPLRDTDSYGYPWTPPIPPGIRLGAILGIKQIPLGAVLAGGATFFVLITLRSSRAGLELRAMGSNPEAAREMGIDTDKRAVLALSLGGAVAGLGGGIELLGHQLRLSPFFSPGFGFTGLVAAVIAGSSATSLLASAFLLAVIRTALQTAERLVGLPSAASYVIQGAILMLAATGESRSSRESRNWKIQASWHARIFGLHRIKEAFKPPKSGRYDDP